LKQVLSLNLSAKIQFNFVDDHGILIHCISGWDRTPLFISLLRLSLWADGWIHQTLTAEEILYLTLAYDWYLFG
jgi:myotubularin-related protein 14